MPTIPYVFEDEPRTIEVTEGDETRPVIVLLHGTGGDIRDMTDPAAGPDNNYDYTIAFPPDVTIGWRAYPGLGLWSCCELDPKKDVSSWRDILTRYKFRTAAYSQVDPSGFLARPVRELAVVMPTLYEYFPKV